MEIQNIEMKTLKEELHAKEIQMLELNKKMLNLEVKTEMLIKANIEMKSKVKERKG